VRGEIAAALSGAVAAADAAAAGDQLPLFPSPIPGRSAKSGRAFDVEALERAAEGRRVGRPPGAVNKSTARMREYMLARGVNPVEWLVRWLQPTPDELAEYLGCTTLEAFREQRIVASELRPVFMPNMAPTDDQGRPVPLVNIAFGPGAVSLGADRKPWEYIEPDQGLGDAAAATSHDGTSHDEAKSEAEQGGYDGSAG
jgi:hypothetical protein